MHWTDVLCHTLESPLCRYLVYGNLWAVNRFYFTHGFLCITLARCANIHLKIHCTRMDTYLSAHTTNATISTTYRNLSMWAMPLIRSVHSNPYPSPSDTDTSLQHTITRTCGHILYHFLASQVACLHNNNISWLCKCNIKFLFQLLYPSLHDIVPSFMGGCNACTVYISNA